jgi:hypothetical protein
MTVPFQSHVGYLRPQPVQHCIPSPKRPCHAGKCSPIRGNKIPLPPAFHATYSLRPPPRPLHRLSASSSICSVPPSGCLMPSSPPRRCLSSSSGSSPLLPPSAAAAQSAANPTIYHGDGSLVPSVEVLGDTPKYICQGTHTIYYSFCIISSLQLQGSRC